MSNKTHRSVTEIFLIATPVLFMAAFSAHGYWALWLVIFGIRPPTKQA